MQEMLDLIQAAQQSHQTLGLMGCLATIVWGLVRIYRLPAIQSLKVLPKWAKWDKQSVWAHLAIVFVPATVASYLVALAAGSLWGAALPMAIASGFAAIGLRGFEKSWIGPGPAPVPLDDSTPTKPGAVQ